ncbi:MAG TPA: DUF308 domain-containing protein [Candidatus Aquilonibacter sp.]|nr:DUF308 domain-containing protein [Candidatus Aquilonibacter sp.]
MTSASAVSVVKKSIGWSIALSVLLIAAGVLAIISPMVAGLAINILVGWLLIFSGCAHLVFAWYRPSAGGLIWELLVGLLYIFTGGYLLVRPVAGLASLTIALAIYLLLESILEFVLGFTLRPLPGSGWLLVDGVITLILAGLILRTWPYSTGWVIGTLVGISMLFSGTSRLMFSLAARGVAARAA